MILVCEMNRYRMVRVLIMFDLPMDDTVAVRHYTQFRKFLIRQGYFMIQYSIYCKIMLNRDSIKSHIEYIKRYLPPDGAVYVLQVTEKQYQGMKLLTGKKQIIEEKLTIDKTIIF